MCGQVRWLGAGFKFELGWLLWLGGETDGIGAINRIYSGQDSNMFMDRSTTETIIFGNWPSQCCRVSLR